MDSTIYSNPVAIDESTIAQDTSKAIGYNHHVVRTDGEYFKLTLEKIIYHMESGNSSPAVIPMMQLLGVTRKHVTVFMDGQGADELLGGYVLSTVLPAIGDLMAQGRVIEAFKSLREFGKTYKLTYATKMALRDLSNDVSFITLVHQKMSGRSSVYGAALRDYDRWKDFMDRPGEGNSSLLGKILQRQHSGGLVNLLHYSDAISMANSMEARMPFLDHRLVEYVWQLPSEYKVHLGTGKALHREAMRGLVPDEVLNQKAKLGFTTPIAEWFRSDRFSGDCPLNVLLEPRSLSRDLFDRASIEKMIREHRCGRKDHATHLFRILNVELWFRRFIDAPIQLDD